ncbi:MAG TPA: winged helix-turn-helix transcriptional regulator [Myxococcales bacterium]|nr:winged helix-turn-helix transcriptional regulator [Myxococcales bacterium]
MFHCLAQAIYTANKDRMQKLPRIGPGAEHPAAQPSQLDLFEADMGFVQVFRSLISTGLLAEIGASALAVLLVIKVSASYQTGESHISMRKIASQTGLSLPTVQMAIHKLEEAGLLAVSRRGKTRKRNFYVVKEMIPFQDARTEEGAGVINFPYIPRKNSVVKREIASFLKTGRTQEGSPIIIRIQNLNIHTGSGDIQNVNLTAGAPVEFNLEEMKPELREAFTRMITRSADARTD